MKVRGYLLAEAVVAGAVLAASIAISFALIAQGRADVTYTAKRAQAAQLGRQKTDQVASGTTCTSVAPSGGLVAVGPTYPGFFWEWSSGDAGGTSTPPLPAGTLCTVSVRVTYPVLRNSPEDSAEAPPSDGRGAVAFTRSWMVGP